MCSHVTNKMSHKHTFAHACVCVCVCVHARVWAEKIIDPKQDLTNSKKAYIIEL